MYVRKRGREQSKDVPQWKIDLLQDESGGYAAADEKHPDSDTSSSKRNAEHQSLGRGAGSSGVGSQGMRKETKKRKRLNLRAEAHA